MCCKEILEDDSVKNLFKKYGVELTTILTPKLGEDLDEELAIIGHAAGTTGHKLMQLRDSIYQITETLSSNNFGFVIKNELKEYIKNYGVYFEEVWEKAFNEKTYLLEYIDRDRIEDDFFIIEINAGTVKISRYFGKPTGWRPIKSISYSEFISIMSPVLFLNLAWIPKDVSELFYYKRSLY